MTAIVVTRAGPLTTLQDAGRFGMLKHGISASGPMDTGAYEAAGLLLGDCGTTAIELAQGLAFMLDGDLRMASAGGRFRISVNGTAVEWDAAIGLHDGDVVEIAPGDRGNYGYLRFEREVEVPAGAARPMSLLGWEATRAGP